MGEDQMKNYEQKIDVIGRKLELISVRLKLLNSCRTLRKEDVIITLPEMLSSVNTMHQKFVDCSTQFLQNCREQQINIRDLNEVSNNVKEIITKILRG